MRGSFRGRRGGLGCDACEAVQALVQGAYEPGSALRAVGGAVQRDGQATVGFLEDDVGEDAGGVVFGEQIGGAADVGGDGAGGAGEQQGDPLQVRRREAGVAGCWMGPQMSGRSSPSAEALTSARSRLQLVAPKTPFPQYSQWPKGGGYV